MPAYSVVGTSLPRVDGQEKVTGAARFAADLAIPGLAHARLVLSPHASARVVSVDLDAARRVAGVVGVYTAADLPLVEPDSGSRKRDFMARDRVFYHGHPVVAVVAETAAAAEDAAALVEIEYAVIDGAIDFEDAVRADAPRARGEKPIEQSAEAQMHATASGGDEEPAAETAPNVSTTLHFHRGDIVVGFSEADVVVEHAYTTPYVHQAYLEPQVTVASVDPLGKLTIYSSTQALFYTRNEVAAALGMQPADVVVNAMTIGGGFGGKFMLIEALVGALCLASRRPVRLEYTRMEDFLAGNPAPSCRIDVKLGATSDGTITAMQARVLFDTGAYSGSPVQIGSILLGGFYKFPNIDIRGIEVLTNKVPAGAYRAPGAVQASYAIESTMDVLADRLGIDRFELRVRNAAQEGDLRPNNQPWPKIGLRQCLESVAGHWRELNARKAAVAPKRIGVGIAIGGWPGGIEPATAICRLNHDGTVSIVLGTVDLSGTDTAFKQIAAEAFGIAPEKVNIVHGDSSSAPYAGGSGGSKITYTVGAAVERAATDARRQLLAIAAQQLEASIDDLELVEGLVRVSGVPERSVPVTAIAAASMSFGGKFEPVFGRGSSAQSTQSPGFAVHLARVAVDTETGKVDVLDYIAAQDVGFAINPAEAEGQIVGGVVQGLGWALYERMAFDESGQLITATLNDYAVPSAGHAPNITPILVEVNSDHGPYGAKGIGEPCVIPVPGCVANAVADALGRRFTSLPMTTEMLATIAS
jgi:CO/xanthine dehydrogenase Mo-binding subunit